MKYLDKNMAKQYNLQEEDPQAVAEAVEPYGITIPVTIPDVGGYTMEYLKRELTAFAMRLVRSGAKESPASVRYSNRLVHLRDMSINHITPEDVKDDERLAYLINK